MRLDGFDSSPAVTPSASAGEHDASIDLASLILSINRVAAAPEASPAT